MDQVKPRALENTPLISVVVPVYKVERFLARCVDSILAQTYPRMEVVLVDDGSPDGCPAICDEYARRDRRVKVIHQQNGGLSAARNAGLEVASGEYIGFVDSDDHIHPEMYARLYAALSQVGADLAVCNYLLMDDADNLLPEENSPITNEVLEGRDSIVAPLGTDHNWNWVVAWAKLYHRSLLVDVRFPLGKLHEDEFFVHHILLKSRKVACIADALYNYVQHGSGITRSGFSLRRLDGAEALFERAKLFHKHGVSPQAAYYACASGLRVLANGYRQLQLKDPAYQDRYRELVGQYRQAARPLLGAHLHLGHKARLMANMVSPYYAWKLVERHMRRETA